MRHRTGQPPVAAGNTGFRRLHAGHQRAVAARPGGTPAGARPGDQTRHPVGQQITQRVGNCRQFMAAQPFGHQRRPGRRKPPQPEGAAVHRHLRAVQRNCLHDAFHAQRNQPALPGEAHQQQVGADRVTQHHAGDARCVHLHDAIGIGVRTHFLQHRIKTQIQIGVRREQRIRRHEPVHDHRGAAMAQLRQSFRNSHHHGIRANHQIHVAVRNARAMTMRAIAQAQMARHRSVTLREAGIVQHRELHALQMSGHAQ